MEEAWPSETLVSCPIIMQCHNQEELEELHSHENLKSSF
jgi:hypothetical protein